MSKDSAFNKILTGIAVSVGATIINQGIELVRNNKTSSIIIGEWDNSYNKINRILYETNKKTYDKHKMPQTNKEWFDLCENTLYYTKINSNNKLKVKTYRDKDTKGSYPEKKLEISFIGKDKYAIRKKFISDALKITDKKHINVNFLGEHNISHDITPHSFDNIVLEDDVKKRIINGLKNWSNSKQWYEQHQLVHKIGLFLYGKAGTGKSTIAKAVSSMFDNAPIVTIDSNNPMLSVSEIIKLRKKYDGKLVVLIEDFDMCFSNREGNENREKTEADVRKDLNQNVIFQLLDGAYSTEDTIYIATTNYRDRIDSALIRYGRFDLQEELKYFDEDKALECVKMLGYNKKILDSFELEYPVQPSYLQSRVMDYRSKQLIK